MIRSIVLFSRTITCRSTLASSHRCLSSSTLKSWERSAKLVKSEVQNEYLEHIRKEHDPALHIKTLEDELRGTMGKALGRQGAKVLRNLEGMKQQLRLYHEIKDNGNVQEIRECVERHNHFRNEAKHARWELMVQRQAVGFLVNNQRYVDEMYPIGDALPLPDDSGHYVPQKSIRRSILTMKSLGIN